MGFLNYNIIFDINILNLGKEYIAKYIHFSKYQIFYKGHSIIMAVLPRYVCVQYLHDSDHSDLKYNIHYYMYI